MFGGAAVLLSPLPFISPMGWVATGRGLAVAGYLAVLTTALAYLLYARGLRTTPVTTATTLGLAEPAIAAVLGLTVLGERLSVAGFCGLAVLAIALLTLAWPRPGSTRPRDLKHGPGLYKEPVSMPYSDAREPSQVPAFAGRDPAQAARRPAARAARLRRRPGGLRQPGAPARPGTDRVRARW